MAFSAALLFVGLLSTLFHSQAFPEPWLPVPPPPSDPPPAALPVAQPNAASGTIQLSTKHQVLASIPESTGPTSQPFITSPSGSYVGCLVRKTHGGVDNDFCYIQVQDAGTGASTWESECAQVSIADDCSAVFSASGLELFDGNTPTWNTGVHAADVESLELGDEGDLKIRTREGEIVWRDSDSPLVNQKCGVASGVPSFATPVDGSTKQPFGEPSHHGGDAQHGDNVPFDSASCRIRHGWLGFAVGFLFLAARGFPL